MGNPPAIPAVFVLEQTLGHVTHAANLRALVPECASASGLDVTFVSIPFSGGRLRRVPAWSNWTLRAGVRTRRALRRVARTTPPDVMLIHTQVLAVFLGRLMRRTPTVISLDATPQQYDDLGESYQHARSAAPIEGIKHRLHLRSLHKARRIVTWSAWTRDDLVARYGIAREVIDVIPPGVDLGRWRPADEARPIERPLEVLFVGGDLRRKGGDALIEACARLRTRPAVPDFVLHLVTTAGVTAAPGIEVHSGLTPNSPELIARFRSADVFVLPTLGDCLPMVLAEAGASGLPLVSTRVGAIPEIVRTGETGELIEPGDVDGLTAALERLLTDPELRHEYGVNARRLVEREHDARANAARLVDVVRTALDGLPVA